MATREEIRSEVMEIRQDMHNSFDQLRQEMKADYRFLISLLGGVLGAIAGHGAVMAHGFNWF